MRTMTSKTRRTMWKLLEGQYQGFLGFKDDLRQGCVISPRPFGTL